MAETVDATKNRIGPAEALKLLDDVRTLVVSVRGKSPVKIDLTRDRPDDTTLIGYLIGPTGNLRAPALRVGSMLLVGFHEEMYREYLG